MEAVLFRGESPPELKFGVGSLEPGRYEGKYRCFTSISRAALDMELCSS
jgi:hypothetical protein